MATSAASSPPRPVAGAFVTAQKGLPASAQEAKAREVVDFEEFVTCLALCGHLKYEEVEQMSLAQRVAGIVANFLGEKDEEHVIAEAVVPKVERFDPASAAPPTGMETDLHDLFLHTWSRMDLRQAFGWPLWEKPVFHLLHRSFPELKSIFKQYASSGGGASSVHGAETMQSTELTNLALDCQLPTEAFPISRIQAIFVGQVQSPPDLSDLLGRLATPNPNPYPDP